MSLLRSQYAFQNRCAALVPGTSTLSSLNQDNESVEIEIFHQMFNNHT